MEKGYKIHEIENGKIIELSNVKIQYDSKGNPLRLSFKDERKFAFDSNKKEWVQWNEKTKSYSGEVRKFNQYQSINNLVKYVKKHDKKIDVTEFTQAVNLQKGQRGAIYGLEMNNDHWEDFKRRQGNFIDSFYEGGFDRWKDDVENGSDNAVKQFQIKVNEELGYNYFQGTDKAGENPYSVDGKFGWVTFSVPGFSEGVLIETEIEPEEIVVDDPKSETESDNIYDDEIGDILSADPTGVDTWFAPDIMNFVGAMTDRISKFKPVQGKVDLTTPGYDLLDPTRQIAANQEQMARYQGMIENIAPPNIALSAALGASGEGFRNVANALSQVENANVQISNQAQMNAAQIENNERMMNQQLKDKYISESAMYGENLAREKSHQKWRRINAWNKGWDNYGRDQMMENVLFPQVRQDNITNEVTIKDGRDPLDFNNPYLPAYGVGSNSNTDFKQYKQFIDNAIAEGIPEDEAWKMLDNELHGRDRRRREYGGETPYSIYDLFD